MHQRQDDQGILPGADDPIWRTVAAEGYRRIPGHYHRERNHQGLDNHLLFPGPTNTDLTAPIERRQRLGGMLNYHYRQAA